MCGNLLCLLAGSSIERPLRKQSGKAKLHFNIHEAWLRCREVRIVLNRDPSWWQRSRPEPVNQAQDLSEQRFGNSDRCELECDVAAMSRDLRTDLDQRVAKRSRGPMLDLLRQRQRAQEVAEIVSECMRLQANRIAAKAVARQTCPVDRVLALFDVLLCRATTVINPHFPINLYI